MHKGFPKAAEPSLFNFAYIPDDMKVRVRDTTDEPRGIYRRSWGSDHAVIIVVAVLLGLLAGGCIIFILRKRRGL